MVLWNVGLHEWGGVVEDVTRVTVRDLRHKDLDANRVPARHKSHALQEIKYTLSLKTSNGLYQTDLRRGGKGRNGKKTLNLLAIIRSGLTKATDMHQRVHPKTQFSVLIPTKHRPSYANGRTANHQIYWLLCRPNVYYCLHRRPSLHHTNPVPNLTFSFLKFIFTRPRTVLWEVTLCSLMANIS